MGNLVQVSLIFAAMFAASLTLSFALGTFLKRRRAVTAPEPNSVIRVRCASGVYRTRFLQDTPDGWEFVAPIQQDSHVPIRIGEPLILEIGCPRGVARFRAELIARESDSHVMLAAHLVFVGLSDRRAGERRLACCEVSFEGTPAKLVDISESGAKVEVGGFVPAGQRVRLDFPNSPAPKFGWVLAHESDGVRVLFEDFACPKS